jgi:Protein of unknown function (DUF1493)
MEDELRQVLIESISRKLAIVVSGETLFFHDLDECGVDPDDQYLLMKEFMEEYSIDMSRFNSSDYISDYRPSFKTLLNTLMGKPEKKKSFKIDHLVMVIRLGKWIEP